MKYILIALLLSSCSLTTVVKMKCSGDCELEMERSADSIPKQSPIEALLK